MNIDISKVEFDSLPREQQVIWLAADGKTDKNISQILGISTDTVSTYWKRIMVKFNSSSRTEVVATFLRQRFEGQMERTEAEKRALRGELRARGSTEQVQASASVHLTSLMGMLDIGILFTSSNLKVSFVNEELCRLAGSILHPREVIGTDLEYFLAICESRPETGNESTFVKVKALMATDLERMSDIVDMTNGRRIERTLVKLITGGIPAGVMVVYKEVAATGKATAAEVRLKDILVERAMAHLEATASKQRLETLLTMERVASTLGADRSMIGEVDLVNGTFNILCSWHKNGEETFTENEQPVPASFFPWLKSQIKEKHSWSFSSLDEIPKAASMERAIYDEAGVQSSLGISFQGNDPNKAYFIDFSASEKGKVESSAIEALSPIRTILRTVIANEKSIKEKAGL